MVIAIATEALLNLEKACSFKVGGRDYEAEQIDARFKELVGFIGARATEFNDGSVGDPEDFINLYIVGSRGFSYDLLVALLAYLSVYTSGNDCAVCTCFR